MPPFANQPVSIQPGAIVTLGIPFDAHSSFLRGPALAPQRIRSVLHSGSSNFSTELGIDLATAPGWADAGDVVCEPTAEAFANIEAAVAELLAQGARVLSLGGDHSITYPILRAYAKQYPDLTILHLDAHPDLYDQFDGNRFSHACPFARIMEAGLATRLVQVGIRTMNAPQRAQADRFGVTVIDMRAWQQRPALDLSGPLYLSLDLDVLDPAAAPGVSHHEPGGLQTRDVLAIIQSLPGPLVGADIVEYNPVRDSFDMTATVAVKCYKEIVGRMIESWPH